MPSKKVSKLAHSHDLPLIAYTIANLEFLRCSSEYCHLQFMPVPE
jgi:hypothetical protein